MNVEKLMFEHLKYTPKDGKVWWIKHPRRSTANGTEAGNMMQNGYRKLKFCNKQYLVHRVAWLLHHGSWPMGDIDHIDGNPSNNRIENLRPATKAENAYNRKISKNNTSGAKGVRWNKANKTWMVSIGVNGKIKYIGSFKDFELAELVAIEARNKIGRAHV